MKTKQHHILNANQAVASIAYKTNEVLPIYPITPASEMSELVEQWSAEKRPNSFNSLPRVFEMQSEAGVAGTMHGVLQTGSLSTTFTASQGLLLMLPNMYKIAGELTPNVIHVATRSIGTHALSIFGDHSDIMACRQSGYAFLGSSSVQEAQDFALIAQAATLQSRVPFVHFFDGFRTSHEVNTIEAISDDIVNAMIDTNLVDAHKKRALNPNRPNVRGTTQGSDVFFQSREATNSYYNACPNIVQDKMNSFEKFTGRAYKIFDYVGHPEAEYVIISMASSTQTIENTINQLNKENNKLGLIKVRLFRPFSAKHLIAALPKSCKSIAVLDKTKEAGSIGEPLYLDVIQAMSEAFQLKKIENLPRILGGRYGLSSKAFTPNMVNAIFNNLKLDNPKNNFTIGIHDDITHLSLNYSKEIALKNKAYEAVFYQNKTKETTQSFNKTLQLTGKQNGTFVQGYAECDYKKSDAKQVLHLRIDSQPIKAPYLIENADFVACQKANFIEKESVLKMMKPKGTLLVSTSLTSKSFWQTLSTNIKYQIIEKEINLYVINGDELKENNILKNSHISELHACFLALNQDGICLDDIMAINDFIYAVDTSLHYNEKDFTKDNSTKFSKSLLEHLLENKGDTVPVSLLPVDGTYESDTSRFNPEQSSTKLPVWDIDTCTQCGACSMACPQAALRIKAYDNSYIDNSPETFKSIPALETDWKLDLLQYTIQINPEQCNSCNNCIDACSVKALMMNNKADLLNQEKQNWNYFESIPELDREKIDPKKVSQQQLQEPLFKYSTGVEGCGEAPYLKLMTQLFGDRLLIANATGASSIFGGALPTTPWSKNRKGHGPAWSNSLFEDNAEFGLGYRLSLNQQEQQAKILLEELLPQLGFDLVYDIKSANQTTETEINAQRLRIKTLKEKLQILDLKEAKQLLSIADALVKKSVWIVGGDGWAYDIGYGGIDHVIATGENVNILVLDNEVYDNTGGQASKATPFGAEVKFAFNGKQKQKKDLGRLAMTYDNVYVASVAIGADQEQTLKAFNEAERFEGPSIIIAYCHSESHGIDMKNPSQYHKAAVNSGQWLMYRNDPRRVEMGLNSLQLDSPVPSIKIKDYLKLEGRFSKLFQNNPEQLNMLMHNYQMYIDKRYRLYLSMTISHLINRNNLKNAKANSWKK